MILRILAERADTDAMASCAIPEATLGHRDLPRPAFTHRFCEGTKVNTGTTEMWRGHYTDKNVGGVRFEADAAKISCERSRYSRLHLRLILVIVDDVAIHNGDRVTAIDVPALIKL